MNSRIQTCFISAGADTNLETLRQVLADRGLKVLVPDFQPGARWADEIESCIKRADLVIGVLGRTRRSDYVLFELGQASALGKQIILIASQAPFLVTSDLHQFQVVRARPSNREAISFALDQLLAAPPPSRHHFAPKPAGVVLGATADAFLQRLENALRSERGSGVEQVTAAVLREAGVEALAETNVDDRRVDLAIWSDGLQPIVGSPLLVEVKQRFTSADSFKKAAQRLSKAVDASGSMWGLLLYGEGQDGGKWLSSTPGNVLVYSLPSLIEEMRTRPFDDVVTALRNYRVHGLHP